MPDQMGVRVSSSHCHPIKHIIRPKQAVMLAALNDLTLCANEHQVVS